MKIIEVLADAAHHPTILGIAETHEAEDLWYAATDGNGRIATRMLVSDGKRQKVLDTLQTVLGNTGNYRVMIIPVDTVLPREEPKKPDELSEEEQEAEKQRKKAALISTREEILAQVEKGATLDSNYLLLVMLSAIVAAIGLLENNIAVIVGAMVIAPLLGPNIAFSLGASLGEKPLVAQSLQTLFAGIALAVLFSVGIGLLWPGDFAAGELRSRTDVGYSGTAIALASGAAASLSLVSGASSVLVGVMVAVALMPPAVTIGLMLAHGSPAQALGAAMLLAVNIVCINLSSQLVFLLRGIKPRTWLQAHRAKQSMLLYISVWVVMLALLVAGIYWRR